MFKTIKIKCLVVILSVLTSSIGYANVEPILIGSCEELQSINNIGNLAKSFQLTGEKIDCSTVENFTPIGQPKREFTGQFDGNKVPIINLIIDRSQHPEEEQDYLGLFGAITGKTTIKNVNLVDAVVKGRDYVSLLIATQTTKDETQTAQMQDNKLSGELFGRKYMGGLIGNIESTYEYSMRALIQRNIINDISIFVFDGGENIGGLAGLVQGTEITESQVYGSIQQFSDSEDKIQNIGGLVGQHYESTIYNNIINQSSTGVDIIGKKFDSVGGLIGYAFAFSNARGEVHNSFATGKIEVGSEQGNVNAGGNSAGGLIGNAYNLTITNSYATGNVTGNYLVGGLMGHISDSNISNSFATGNINGYRAVGGLIGQFLCRIISYSCGGTINNTYARGDVTGVEDIGGLIGYTAGRINNSYSTGKVKGSFSVGGLIGDVQPNTEAKTTSSYWDKNTSGQNISRRGVGYTTTQLQDSEYLIGWDFNTVWRINSEKYAEFQYQQSLK